MEKGRMFLKLAEPVDTNAAVFAYAAEIVAKEIYDHRVLGTVFGASSKVISQLFVLLGSDAASASAFDR